ncbi:hypothetical protein ACLOJK_013753 [Asimina triloba]
MADGAMVGGWLVAGGGGTREGWEDARRHGRGLRGEESGTRGVGGGDGRWDDGRWLAAGWSLEGAPRWDSGWPMGGRWAMASWLAGKTKTQGIGASRERRRVGERRREGDG